MRYLQHNWGLAARKLWLVRKSPAMRLKPASGLWRIHRKMGLCPHSGHSLQCKPQTNTCYPPSAGIGPHRNEWQLTGWSETLRTSMTGREAVIFTLVD
jgi:hypothetical protein